MSKARVAVLTVSDTASKDANADKSGPTIKGLLLEQGYLVNHSEIVPDEVNVIQLLVQTWCASGDVDWIITTGGTGFGVRDTTPEAIAPLIERHASGLVHLLLGTSLKYTPLAALSRPVAGTIKDTLIVTLPGSVKAVKENIEALLTAGVVDHAIELIKGGSGKATHSALAASSSSEGKAPGAHAHSHSHAHHHHHGHDHDHPRPRTTLSQDPSLPATARHRISPYRLFSYDEAISTILKEIRPLKTSRKLVNAALRGHILAEDVYAPHDVPNTFTTSVDGYAVRSTDPPGIYRVVTSATHNISEPLPESTIYRINTGGPLPAGTDSVVMVEDTRLVSSITDAEGNAIEEKEVEILVSGNVGENIRNPGSDVKEGELVLQKGDVIHSAGGEIGTLAFVGRQEVEVFRKPVVAILSTGNEIVDIHRPVSLSGNDWGGIWDTNRPSLQAALEGLGYEVVDLGIVSDTVEAHVEAIKQGMERADILLTTGGTSMGASDLFKPVIERRFNGTIHFGRVAIKPGKPTTFATIPAPESDAGRKPTFALPGNPASALVTFHIFVVPALRKLAGHRSCQFPRMRVKLNDAMRLDSRVEFHRVIIRVGQEGPRAYSTGGQRSSRVASLSGANGLVMLPQKVEGGPDRIEAGAEADAYIIGELQMA